MAAVGQRIQNRPNFPTNQVLARHLDPIYQIWIKFGMVILLNPGNKWILFIDLDKIVRNILLDTRNKPVKGFLFIAKSKMAAAAPIRHVTKLVVT